MDDGVRIEDGVLLTPQPDSIPTARRFVGRCLAGWGHADETEIAVLLTSEVVTNAVVHGGPHGPSATIALLVELADGRARVEVHDASSVAPRLGDGDIEATSGRGLLLIEALATKWGVTADDSGKTVWFEVHARPALSPESRT